MLLLVKNISSSYVPVSMICWTHEMRRSRSDNIRATVGSGSPCSSWRRSGTSWTAHVREVLRRWGWRRRVMMIIPAVVVRIHRETIRRWDVTWTGVPVTRETWTVWNRTCARGRRMNRAKVGYIWTWVTRCWSCWFCKVALLAQEVLICVMESDSNKIKEKKRNN